MAPTTRSAMTLLALALLAVMCGAALAAPGTFDDSQRDYNVPGKEPTEVVASDFKSTAFKGFNLTALKIAAGFDETKTPGGFGVKQNAENFPILNYAGVSGGLVVYGKKGQNSFHVHPRGNELVTVIVGGPLECQLVDSNGKLFKFVLNKGDTGFFPKGLAHLQQNGATKTTLAIQAFSSANAGTSRTIPAIFAGETDELLAGFNYQLSASKIIDIRKKLLPGFPKKK